MPGAVTLTVPGPATQRRATVAFRLILAIPHLIALCALGIAAAIVVIIGWFGALATGRLPRFAAAYLSGYLSWYGRTGAYLLLLTDQYPPFELGDTAYPVRVAVSPGKLSRLTVLLRIILAIPAAIVSMVLVYGVSTIIGLIAWLTALVAGRLPGSMHQGFAAVLRYTIRYYAYLYLLTGTYPGGLFGDQPGDSAPVPALPAYMAPAAVAPGQDTSWQLVLTPRARRFVGLILVLGLLTVAGEGAAVGTAINSAVQRDHEINQLNIKIARHNAAVGRLDTSIAREQQASGQASNALTQVSDAHDSVLSAVNSPAADSSNCSTVSCFNTTAVPVANAFAAFQGALHATPIPAGSTAAAKRLSSDTAENEQDWTEISQATSFTSIENIATAAETVGSNFDNDYTALVQSLGQVESTLQNQAAALDSQAATLNSQAAELNQQAAALNATADARSAQSA